MINRYHGNSGKMIRMEEPRPISADNRGMENKTPAQPRPEMKKQYPHSPPAQKSRRSGGGNGAPALLEKLGKLLPAGGSKLAGLETEDIILLLILYLMYRESGDSELLMIMGAMFLL